MNIALEPLDNVARQARGSTFDYRAAFDRNIGWLTESEQWALRKKTVAIAGLGGVGGAHVVTLTRLGIGGFHLADFDRFDIANLNRQMGAFMSTQQLEKTSVLADMARDINPEMRLKPFPNGLDEDNLDAFLTGVDLFVDGLDFFTLEIRKRVFERCAQLCIPAITAAPIGFGTSYILFMPGQMSFEQYFRLGGLSEEKQYVNFALGLTPKGFHRSYLADPTRLDLKGKRGPSTAAAVQLCAGVAGVEAVKILLDRGKLYPAPYYHQFDAYSGQWHRGKLRFGNAGPLQSIKRAIGYRAFSNLSKTARPTEELAEGSDIERILDLARWAPSGDNTQPWRFEVLSSDRVLVHLFIEGSQGNIYDYADGQPTLLSGGFLLETLRIAASRFGRSLSWRYVGEEVLGRGALVHKIEVDLEKDGTVSEDDLCPHITVRSVDRRSYRRAPLTPSDKAALEGALGEEMHIEWRESFSEKWAMARLCSAATGLRLHSEAAYKVHQRIIDWEQCFSATQIPAASIGLDRLTLKLMRFVMGDWRRVAFMNRFLAGTVMPRIQLDLIPGANSAGYFVVRSRSRHKRGSRVPRLLKAGMALQRFWLTATHLGLSLQPTLAPLCFAHYGRDWVSPHASMQTSRYAAQVKARLGEPEDVIFMGRIGRPKGRTSKSRSTRLLLSELTKGGCR